MSQINPIHTPCKQCVFAKYENITQTNCFLNYIDKYRNNNTEILEAYDDEKEFYIINGKKCIGYRENSWFEKKNMSNATIEEKIQEYHSDNHIHYLLVINLDKYSYDDFDDLKNQILSLAMHPSKIIFIRYQNKEPIYPLEVIQNFIASANLQCKWRIQTMVDDSSYDDILHSIINLNKKYRFVFSLQKHYNNIKSIIDMANTIVYDNLDRFTIISNSSKTALLFSTPSYRFYLASERKNIFDYQENYIFTQ